MENPASTTPGLIPPEPRQPAMSRFLAALANRERELLDEVNRTTGQPRRGRSLERSPPLHRDQHRDTSSPRAHAVSRIAQVRTPATPPIPDSRPQPSLRDVAQISVGLTVMIGLLVVLAEITRRTFIPVTSFLEKVTRTLHGESPLDEKLGSPSEESSIPNPVDSQVTLALPPVSTGQQESVWNPAGETLPSGRSEHDQLRAMIKELELERERVAREAARALQEERLKMAQEAEEQRHRSLLSAYNKKARRIKEVSSVAAQKLCPDSRTAQALGVCQLGDEGWEFRDDVVADAIISYEADSGPLTPISQATFSMFLEASLGSVVQSSLAVSSALVHRRAQLAIAEGRLISDSPSWSTFSRFTSRVLVTSTLARRGLLRWADSLTETASYTVSRLSDHVVSHYHDLVSFTWPLLQEMAATITTYLDACLSTTLVVVKVLTPWIPAMLYTLNVVVLGMMLKGPVRDSSWFHQLKLKLQSTRQLMAQFRLTRASFRYLKGVCEAFIIILWTIARLAGVFLRWIKTLCAFLAAVMPGPPSWVVVIACVASVILSSWIYPSVYVLTLVLSVISAAHSLWTESVGGVVAIPFLAMVSLIWAYARTMVLHWSSANTAIITRVMEVSSSITKLSIPLAILYASMVLTTGHSFLTVVRIVLKTKTRVSRLDEDLAREFSRAQGAFTLSTMGLLEVNDTLPASTLLWLGNTLAELSRDAILLIDREDKTIPIPDRYGFDRVPEVTEDVSGDSVILRMLLSGSLEQISKTKVYATGRTFDSVSVLDEDTGTNVTLRAWMDNAGRSDITRHRVRSLVHRYKIRVAVDSATGMVVRTSTGKPVSLYEISQFHKKAVFA